MIKTIFKIFAIACIAVITFGYMGIYQRGELNETNHFKQIGKGIGQTFTETTKIPGKIKESQQWQDFKEGLSDTTKTK
tara:strand:- start:6174 stop:6407 length:234 start_codon:yes stop_codon:yes gene_type:complete